MREDEKKKELLKAYEEVLVSELKVPMDEISGVGIGPKHALVTDFVKRERELSDKAADQGRINARATMANVANAVFVVKGYGDRVATVDPHVGMAWAGVSALLPVSNSFRTAATQCVSYVA